MQETALAQIAQETAMGISSPWGNFVLERTFFGPPVRWFFRFVQVSIVNHVRIISVVGDHVSPYW